MARRHGIEGSERHEGTLDGANAGREKNARSPRASRGRSVRRWEDNGLGAHDHAQGQLGPRGRDPRGHRAVKHRQGGRPLENVAHRRSPLRIRDIVIGVGAREGDDQREPERARHAQSERPRVKGVKGVHESRPPLAHFALDGGRLRGREIPDPRLDTSGGQPGGDSLDGDGVAARGRKGERGQHGDAPDDALGHGAQAYRGALAGATRARNYRKPPERGCGMVPPVSPHGAREGLMADAPDEMECRECMDLLADYVDGALPKHQAELLEWHLEGCGPCVAFVRTYKGTVYAAKRLRETTLPPELKEKLRAFLKRSVRQ